MNLQYCRMHGLVFLLRSGVQGIASIPAGAYLPHPGEEKNRAFKNTPRQEQLR